MIRRIRPAPSRMSQLWPVPRRHFSHRPFSTGPASTARLNLTATGVSVLLGLFAYSQLTPATVLAEASQPSASASASPSRARGVDRSTTGPGVFVWGDNSSKVADPTGSAKLVKTPVRLPFFDGVYLRDLKLGAGFGAAIDEAGDLIMWGTSFSPSTEPKTVLRGLNLKSLAVSKDRVIVLSRDGQVFSLPAAEAEQSRSGSTSVSQPSPPAWWQFWKTSTPSSNVAIRPLTPENLVRGEKVKAISAGLYHALILTNRGRVFSSVASTEEYPDKGQMGIPGLRWDTRPVGKLDQCMPITALDGVFITDIATGDFHSIVRDQPGQVFGFGDNSFGQLGIETVRPDQATTIEVPEPVPFGRHYDRAGRDKSVSMIAAGGLNSFFVVESVPRTGTEPDKLEVDHQSALRYNHRTLDLWACGNGITGSLGTGRWTHVQAPPTLVTALSGLFEYSERNRRFFPLPVSALSVGSTHVAAVVDTTDTTGSGGRWWTGGGGTTTAANKLPPTMADVMVFGGNEFWQLGTGKRANAAVPSFLPPLDRVGDEVVDSAKAGRHMTVALRQRAPVGGRDATVEQRVEAGRGMTAVYWAVVD